MIGTPALALLLQIGISFPGPGPVGAAAPATVTPATAAPVAGTFNADQTFTLSGGTAGASSCVRTDGVDPTAATPGTCDSPAVTYSTGITFTSTTTFKWIGTKAAMTNSAVQTAAYTLTSALAFVQIPNSPFTLTSVANHSGATTVYTGTITGGGASYVNRMVTISGFSTAANNGNFQVTAANTTTITVSNGAGASETHAATVKIFNVAYCQQAATTGAFSCPLISTTAGNLGVGVEFDFAGGPGLPTTPTNWTRDCSATDGSNGRITYFSRPNITGGVTSVTFTPATGAASGLVGEISGAALSSPYIGPATCAGFGQQVSTWWNSNSTASTANTLAIGSVINRQSATRTFAPTDVWSTLLDAPQTHDGDEGWTEYIINGLQSPYAAQGTMATSNASPTMALYKSAVTGATPAGNPASSFTSMEVTEGAGTTITAAILDESTKGVGLKNWTAGGSGFTVCANSGMGTVTDTTVNGTTYPAAAGTKAICYALSSNPVQSTVLTFPNAVTTASAYVNFTTPNATLGGQNNMFQINGAGGADYAAVEIDISTGKWGLECHNGGNHFFSPTQTPAQNTEYGLSVQYVGGGTHTFKLYTTPSTSPSLLGTATCPSDGGTVGAISITFGQNHNQWGDGTQPTGINQFKGLKINIADGALLTP